MSVPKAKKKKSPLKKADPHDIIRLTNEVNMAVNIRIMRQVYGFGKKRLQDYIEAYTSLLMELADGRNTARKIVRETEELCGIDVSRLLSDLERMRR